MKKISHSFGVIMASCLILMCSGKVSAQTKIDPKGIQEDFEILRDIAIGVSPKIAEEDSLRIIQQFKENENALGFQPMTAIDFLNAFSKMDLETQFDEHARLELEGNVMMPFLSSNKLFPLSVLLCGKRLLVNNEGLQLPFGTIIHSINGIPTDSLLPQLAKDFDNTFSKKRLEEQFALIYLIKFGNQDFFNLTYSLPSNTDVVLEKELAAEDFQTWQTNMQSTVIPYRQSELIRTKFFEEQDAFYFQLGSFSMGDEDGKGLFSSLKSERKKFKSEIKKVFQDLEKSGAQNLIIDLRYNMGGNIRVPGILYSYIALKPFTEQAILEIPDFNLPHKELISKVGSTPIEKEKEVDKFLSKWESGFEKSDDGFTWEFIEKNSHQPNKKGFKGRVYLLVGGRSISASSYFSALFKSQERGVIIGEELGGSHHSITAGTSVTYKLPNTQISVVTPLMVVSFSDELYSAVPEKKVIPEISVSENERYDYIIQEKDPELEIVFRHITNNAK